MAEVQDVLKTEGPVTGSTQGPEGLSAAWTPGCGAPTQEFQTSD